MGLYGSFYPTAATAALPTDHVNGLIFSWVSATTVRIGAGSCRSADDTTNMVSTGNLDAVITASGENGLDTGSEATGTWYAVYIISDAAGTTVASLLSTDANSPTMPSGYTKKRRVGWAHNHSDGHIQSFHQAGLGREKCMWWVSDPAFLVVLDAGTNTGGRATVSCATRVPLTAHHMLVRLMCTDGDANVNAISSIDGPNINWWVSLAEDDDVNTSAVVEWPCPYNKSFDYETYGAANVSCSILGWKETI